MRDENSYNEEWLENAKENFEQACDEENYSLARDIIADVWNAGFPAQARTLTHTLIEIENMEMMV